MWSAVFLPPRCRPASRNPANRLPGHGLPFVIAFCIGCLVPLSAGESNKVTITIPMVRVEVVTPNPAVNQTYELEIEAFDGQSLRGFEPAKEPGAVRAMISIQMASVIALQFFTTTLERDVPKPERPRTPGGSGERDPNTPGNPLFKDLQRRLESPDGERSDFQIFRLLQTIKEPEYLALIAHVYDLLGSADTEEKARNLARNAVLIEFLHASLETARNYQHVTRTAYFRQTPATLAQAKKQALEAAKDQPNPALRAVEEKAIETPEWTAIGLVWAVRVWNETVPADRIEEPGGRKPPGGLGGGKPFKGLRPGRPAENP